MTTLVSWYWCPYLALWPDKPIILSSFTATMWSPTPIRPSSPTAPPLSTDFTTQPHPSSSPLRVSPGMTRKQYRKWESLNYLRAIWIGKSMGVNVPLQCPNCKQSWHIGIPEIRQLFADPQVQHCRQTFRKLEKIVIRCSISQEIKKTERCQNVLWAVVGSLVGCNWSLEN